MLVYSALSIRTDQHAIDRLSIDQSVDYYRGTFQDDRLARRRTSAARSTVAKFVTVWSIPFISSSDETKGVAHGWKLRGGPGFGIVELPRLHLTEGPQIYHRGPLPAPDIISPPPISCPVIRNPGAPTAHLFMSWHFFPPVLLFPFPSFAHTSLELDGTPARNNQILHRRNAGRTRLNFFLA